MICIASVKRCDGSVNAHMMGDALTSLLTNAHMLLYCYPIFFKFNILLYYNIKYTPYLVTLIFFLSNQVPYSPTYIYISPLVLHNNHVSP